MESQPTLAPPADPPPPRPSRGDRFFGWTSSLGVVRADGWFGGVAAGVAARWGVDPLIVRGILVVLGVIGIPIALLYGAAWAVLPDAAGRIPAQEARDGRFHAGQVGAAIFVAASFVPSPIGLLLGLPASSVFAGVASDGLAAVTVIVASAAILFAVIVALLPRRRVGATPPPPQPDASDPVDASVGPEEPAAPGREADDDELARWREQHAEWKAHDQAWRREQQDAARAARDQLRRERQERTAAFAAEAAARRRERQTVAPRAPHAFVALAIGAALITGTIVALTTQAADPIASGLFVAALVLAGAMTVAGILRRRSGFLAFVTTLTLVGGLAATGFTVARVLHLGSWGISNVEGPFSSEADPFVQPWGDLSISLQDTGEEGIMRVEKRSGATSVYINNRVRVDVTIVTETAAVGVSTPSEGWVDVGESEDVARTTTSDGRTRYSFALGGESARTTETLVIEQDSGYIDLNPEADIAPEGPSS